MRGIFCITAATTNEEYRKELKKKNFICIFMMILGLAVAVTVVIAEKRGTVGLSSHIMGVYCGVASGIAFGGLILLIKNLRTLANEDKLKQSRVENSDERLTEIRSKSIQVAIMVMMAVCLVGALIGGIFYPFLIKALLVVLYTFLLSYIIAFAVYKRKM